MNVVDSSWLYLNKGARLFSKQKSPICLAQAVCPDFWGFRGSKISWWINRVFSYKWDNVTPPHPKQLWNELNQAPASCCKLQSGVLVSGPGGTGRLCPLPGAVATGSDGCPWGWGHSYFKYPMVNCIWSTFRNETQWHAVFVFYICSAEPGRIRWQRQVAGRNESSEGIVGEVAVWNLLLPMANTLASWHLLVLAWHMCKKRQLSSRSLRCWPQGQVWWEYSIFSSVFPSGSQGTWRLLVLFP